METKKYCGVVVPMVTPVTPEGRLDTLAVGRIIDSFVKNRVSPLLMGTTGEGNSVSPADARLLVETSVKAAAGQATVYAGLTGNCISEQRAQVDAFTALGADVIVATLPSYYALTPAQMEKYKKQFRYPETFMRFGGEIVAIPIKPHSRPAGEKHKTEPER